MSTNYDPNNWGRDEKFYSSSSGAASKLQPGLEPSKLDISSQTTQKLIFLLGQQKYSSLLGFDNQNKVQALFAPQMSPAGGDREVIIGNLSDKKSQYLLGIVDTTAIGKVPLIVNFEDIPQALRGRVPIPASVLKGTPLEVNDVKKADSDLGIVYVPNVVGLHPGMKNPAGSIDSERVNQALAFNSSAYSEWLELMKLLASRDDDLTNTTSLIHETLAEEPETAKYVCGNLVQDEDKVISAHFFSTSFISDEEEKDHSAVLDDLGNIFKPNPTPARQDQHQSRASQDTSTNNDSSVSENLSKFLKSLNEIVEGSTAKKDKDDYVEGLALARLKLLGLKLVFDFDKCTVTSPRLSNFSATLSNILLGKETKTVKVERLGLAAKKVFNFKSTDRQQQQNMLYILRSLRIFTRPFLQAHLDGRISSEDVQDISRNTTALTVVSYLPQNDNKAVTQAIQEEDTHRSEIRLEVAETQRTGQATSIMVFGKINESKDSDKVFANAANMMMLMFDVSTGNTAFLELLEHCLYTLTTPEVSEWEKSDGNQHFTFTKLEIAAQIIKAVGAFTEDTTNIDVIESESSLDTLDFSPITRLLKSLKLTLDEIEVAVTRGTSLRTVSNLTPDEKNPNFIEKRALIAQFANVSTNGGSSGTRQNNKLRQATQSPPASPTKKSQHRDKRMKSNDDKSNDVVDKLKARNKRNEERRMKIGLIKPNQGVNPAQCIPSSLSQKPCVFFMSIDYDCGKGNLCPFAHHHRHSDFPTGDFEKLLDHINDKKCAKLSSNWLKKNNAYVLPDKYKHLVDSTL